MAVKLVKPINHKKVVKITNQDFEAKMRELRVNSDIAVAVSGGPDSLALMHLSNRYALNNNINLAGGEHPNIMDAPPVGEVLEGAVNLEPKVTEEFKQEINQLKKDRII